LTQEIEVFRWRIDEIHPDIEIPVFPFTGVNNLAPRPEYIVTYFYRDIQLLIQRHREFCPHLHAAHAQVDGFGDLLDFELLVDNQVNELEAMVLSPFILESLGFHGRPPFFG
jgi:hypothetical protein